MGPLSEHFRSSETLAQLREAEIARTFARRQALGQTHAAGPRRPSVLRSLANRISRRAPAPAASFESECEPAIDAVRPANA